MLPGIVDGQKHTQRTSLMCWDPALSNKGLKAKLDASVYPCLLCKIGTRGFYHMTDVNATYAGCGKDVTVLGVAVLRFHVGNTDTTRIKW